MLRLDYHMIEWLQEQFLNLIFTFFRISSLMVAAPFYSNPVISPRLKIILSLILAFFALPLLPETTVNIEPFSLVRTIFGEVIIGLLIGFTVSILFYALRFAGGMIDIDMGFQAASLFNLDIGIPSLLGELHYLIGIMIFLLLNGHLYILEATILSFQLIPINTFLFSQESAEFLIEATAVFFVLALKIASPILISLFISNLALALLARVAPQTNIFILSFQIKIAVGLLLLFATTPFLITIIRNALELYQSNLTELLFLIQRR